MKFIIFIFVVVMTTGLLSSPVFVMASNTCYVDEDADGDEDGSKDDPYQEIEKALDEDCEKIIVSKGTYKDDIIIGDTEIEGKDKDDVIITGKITMKNGAHLKQVTVSSSGVDVKNGARVVIEDAKIKNTNIGINTEGDGKLTVDDVVLYDNRKAMYLQKGTNVKITNSEVYDNDEEGIDIRANVDGIISGNSIHDNGESGIEVIVGKSELDIINNKIKKNGASGIAAQYYTSAGKLGGVKIKDNTITNNKDFGINCKAPSGGNPGVEYWTKSMEMLANKVYDNKDGEFSDSCYFSAEKVSDATKTKKQKEEEQKQKEQQIKAEQEKKDKEILTAEEQKKEEEQKKLEQDVLRKKLQKEKDLQGDIESLEREINEFYNFDNISREKIKNRPSIVVFFIGPNYKELRNMAERIEQYDIKIQEATNIKNIITDEMIQKKVEENITSMIQKKESMYNFIKINNEEFSFFGWFFKKRL